MAARIPDYVAIGHLTIDRTPRGDTLGGTVLYAALTAARAGMRAAILTRASLDTLPDDQREALAVVASEVEIVAQASSTTTTFTNRDVAGRRVQELHAWAGEIDLNGLPPHWRTARVIHLAPVAQEIDPRSIGRLSPQLMGCTPQGWMREWDRRRFGAIRSTPLRLPPDLIARIDSAVISSEESVAAREVIEEVGRRSLAAITRSQQGAVLIDRGRRTEVRAYASRAVDTVGAGDVFAAGLFASRADGESVAASARYASAAAALKVQAAGLQSVPDRKAVEGLIERQSG